MVVGGAHHVEAEPFELFEQFRRRCHIGAVGDPGRSLVPMAHHRFKISGSDIAVTEYLHQGEEFRLVEYPQAAREHAVARQRNVEISGL